ncbi:MAG: ergothioneine biosynthesis protein EgtB [Betaproteobacteria bacterium]
MRPTRRDAPALLGLSSELARRYEAIRARTDALAAPLSAEDCALQSMPDASPVKWHLAHTSWFFETFVLEPRDGFAPFDPAFRTLFNSYYVGIGDRHPRPERGLLSRPDLATVRRYRAHVDGAMRRLVAANPDPATVARIDLGLHHEQQHQELILADLKHLLSRNPTAPVYRAGWPLAPVRPSPVRWVAYAGGLESFGHAGDGFAFDNETPRHRVFLAPFELASRPVTHGEFAAFVEEDGYRRPELWLSAGFDTAGARGWAAPMYWLREGDAWTTFTLHGRVPIDAHTPMCHLSFYEADAYARWAGARLPSEFEWELAARDVPVAGNLLESGALHPMPLAGGTPPGTPAQLWGDVWEWTRSDYAPYPGYAPAKGAIGEYNGKFMSGQTVLRGGSCATPATHLRATYRNFFPPDARWQFSGLRLARDAAA